MCARACVCNRERFVSDAVQPARCRHVLRQSAASLRHVGRHGVLRVQGRGRQCATHHRPPARSSNQLHRHLTGVVESASPSPNLGHRISFTVT